MRIACPTCSAAYDVPPERVPPGKGVRCAKCGVVWTPVATVNAEPEIVAAPEPGPPATAAVAVSAEQEAAAVSDRAVQGAIPPVAESRTVPVDEARAIETEGGATGSVAAGSMATGSAATGSVETGSVETGSIGTRSIETGSSETGSIETGTVDTAPGVGRSPSDDPGEAPIEPGAGARPARALLLAGWMVTAVILGVATWFAVARRADVVAVWPASERAYVWLGLPL